MTTNYSEIQRRNKAQFLQHLQQLTFHTRVLRSPTLDVFRSNLNVFPENKI